MVKYTIQRLILIFFTLFIILSLSFILIKLLPSYPPLDPNMDPQQWLNMQQKWGYDKPVFIQYLMWLRNVIFSWDWGVSTEYRLGADTFDILTQFLPVTMRLNIISFLISMPLGVLFGIIAALRKNKPTDYIIRSEERRVGKE